MLSARLAPHAERHLVVGGALCQGAAALPLAKLATLAERRDEARACFEAAIERNDALGAVPWSAHARAWATPPQIEEKVQISLFVETVVPEPGGLAGGLAAFAALLLLFSRGPVAHRRWERRPG